MEWCNYSTEREILRLIYKTARRCVMFCQDILKPYGITFPQSVLMFLIKEHQDRDLCQKDIEKMVGIKGSSISSLLNNMSKKNFIIRKPCEKDGRKYIIKITDSGEELMNRMAEDSADLDLDLFKNLSSDEKEQLIKILLKIS